MTRRLARVAALTLLLSGCAVLGKGPAALDTYDLTAPSVSAGGRSSHRQILIAEPSALKPFDGENIVIETKPGSIQYLKGAQWADRLPKIVQARLAEAFQKSHRFGGVGRPGEGLAIDYQVICDIRSFEIKVDGGSHATVEIYVRILNDRNGVVRAEKLFGAAAPVAGAGNDAFVDALNRAFGDAAGNIVSWSSARM